MLKYLLKIHLINLIGVLFLLTIIIFVDRPKVFRDIWNSFHLSHEIKQALIIAPIIAPCLSYFELKFNEELPFFFNINYKIIRTLIFFSIINEIVFITLISFSK